MKQCEQGLGIISCAPNILFPVLMIVKYTNWHLIPFKWLYALEGLKGFGLKKLLQYSVDMPSYIHL